MTEVIVALVTLIALEVILEIDNIIFISILADKLPEEQRRKLRLWGRHGKRVVDNVHNCNCNCTYHAHSGKANQ